MDRLEYLLQKLIKGEKIKDWNSLSRLESYLLACINKGGIEQLGLPLNRLEVLLHALYEQMKNNSGSGEGSGTTGEPIQVSTPNEMDSYLTEENVGKVFKYIGESNETYIQNEIYIIEEV